jgi:transcriptional regulator with XRE-family HTH domain
MYDASAALADMAQQIRTCRAQEGLTLQKLAARSGVAASTIHKIEAQQMVPTVSVLFKIAKGLDRRPEELIRDAIVLVEMGAIDLQAGKRRILLDTGDCIEVEGERIESPAAQSDPTRLTLIVSPPGNLDRSLGSPRESQLSL